MKTVLITGVSGFVGRHLSARLLQSGFAVAGFDRTGDSYSVLEEFLGKDRAAQVTKLQCDLGDSETVAALFAQHRFDAIVHLAGISFPPIGWKDPTMVLEANTRNAVGLLQSARQAGWRGRFLFVSSSDVYGRVSEADQPITEETKVQPDNPYGASKAAAELFVKCLSMDGIEAIIARPFNHIGPGQAPDFVLPSFLNRIRQCQAEGRSSIETGDLSSARDFTDVRDVVAAYEMLLSKGTPGAVYNICSGQPITIRQLLETALSVTGASLSFQTNEALLRPDGTTIRYGSCARLRTLGWSPVFGLEETVRDTARAMGVGSFP